MPFGLHRIAIIGLVVILIKNRTEKTEVIIGTILIVLCLEFAAKEFYHSVNPEVENITVNLSSYHRPPYRIGYEGSFIDVDGENDNLYINPLTLRKNIGNGDLINNRMYKISYDIDEQVIIKVTARDMLLPLFLLHYKISPFSQPQAKPLNCDTQLSRD